MIRFPEDRLLDIGNELLDHISVNGRSVKFDE